MSEPEKLQLSTTQISEHSRIRLDYLDGMRGLAALYVVLFHTYIDIQPHLAHTSRPLRTFVWLVLGHGKISVAIFIVLSGYCLMLPVARSVNGQIKGGVINYIKRRAQRILPPYYAALVVSLLLWAFIPTNAIIRAGSHWSFGYPALTTKSIMSHVLLIQDVFGGSLTINHPMWSVAVEWHIYFLFPMLLLPVWRRFGIIAAIGTACIAALALNNLMVASQYILLFTFGMSAAVIGFSRQPSLVKWRAVIPWDIVSLTAIVGCIPAVLKHQNEVVEDTLVGLATALVIICCSQFLAEGRDTRFRGLVDLLQGRWVVGLGTFSYSLYLIHAVALASMQLCLSNIPTSIRCVILIILVLPISIAVAYVFHLLFEKPFMSKKR